MESKNLVRWLASASIARLASQIVSWACTIIVMRTLSPNDYSAVAIAEAVFVLLLILVEYPYQIYLVRCTDRAYERRGELIGMSLSSAIIGALFLLGLSYPLSLHYGNADIGIAFQLKAIHLLLSPFKSSMESNLLRHLRFGSHATGLFIEVIVTALTSLTLALYGYGLYALLLGPMTGALTRILFMMLHSQSSITLKLRPKRWFRQWKLLRSLITNDSILRIDTPITLLLLSLVLTPSAIGLFSAAQYWAAIPVGKALAIINQVTLPVFSKLRQDDENTVLVIDKFLSYFAVLAVPIFWGLAAVSPEFIRATLGAKWADAAILLAIMALPMPFRLVRDFAVAPLMARSLDSDVKKMHLVHTISQILFTVLGGYFYGALGAAVGMCAAASIDAIYCFHRLGQCIAINKKAFLRSMMGALIAAAGMLISIRMVSGMASKIGNGITMENGNLITLSILILSGIPLYTLLSFVFNRKAFLAKLNEIFIRERSVQ